MKRSFCGTQSWTRQFHSTARFRAAPRPITLAPSPLEHAHLNEFRGRAFTPGKPILLGHDAGSPGQNLPAARKWFANTEGRGTSEGALWTLAPYMSQFKDWPFPYELMASSVEKQNALIAFRDSLASSQDEADQLLAGLLQPTINELGSQRFFQIYAPLQLLIKALDFNKSQPQGQLLELYIAQSSLPDLPPALLDDLPTPELVQKAGKGDVYSSSIWLGTEPTYTPLHRDPNPNLFCQLCNHKVIRLMPPATGDRLFFEVQARIRQQGNSRIRTVEMMEGKEREVLHQVVWEPESAPEEMVEAELGPGDALFIPNGWWHSVKSRGTRGHLNGSVNWWFR